MKIRALLLVSAMIFSAGVSAQGVSGLGYYQLDDDDIAVGALVGSVGYRYQANDVVSFVPEIRGGFGVKDDNFLGAKVKLKGLVGAALRAEFAVSEPVYVFASTSYTHYKFKASVSGVGSASASDEEFGFGGGIGFNVAEEGSIELSYEKLDEIGVIGASLRFNY